MRTKINKRKIKIEIDDECITCDICHSEEIFPTTKEEGHWASRGDLDRVFFPGIARKINGVEYSFDICSKCFVDKVIPFLQSVGVAVEAG